MPTKKVGGEFSHRSAQDTMCQLLTRVDAQEREPASIDADTAAALRVWGTIE